MCRAKEDDLRLILMNGICNHLCVCIGRILCKEFVLQNIYTVCPVSIQLLDQMIHVMSCKYGAKLRIFADFSRQLISFPDQFKSNVHQFSLSLLGKDPDILIFTKILHYSFPPR